MACAKMLLLAATAGSAAVFASAQKTHSFQYKMLNGPPSEFPHMSIPAADKSSVYSAHVSGRFNFAKGEDAQLEWATNFNVDSHKGFAFALFTGDAKATYTLMGPDSKLIDLSKYQSKASAPAGDSPDQVIEGLKWMFPSPTKPGTYRLTVMPSSAAAVERVRAARAAKGFGARKAGPKSDGYYIIWNDSANLLLAHATYPTMAVVGGMVGVAAQMVDSQYGNTSVGTWMAKGTAPPPSEDKITDARLEVTFPDGTMQAVKMADDGLHEDGAADDAVYGGMVKASESGVYHFRTVFEGVDPTGASFSRAYQQDLAVADDSVALNGNAVGVLDSKGDRLTVRLPVRASSSSPATVFRPYMEVWSAGAEGKPIAYATNLAKVQQTRWGFKFVEVEVDLKWAAMAGVVGKAGFVLKNVMIENMITLSVISESASVPVFVVTAEEATPATLARAPGSGLNASTAAGLSRVAASLARLAATFDGKVTAEMREGVKPAQYHNNSAQLANGKVVLVHGFCADKNPFESQASDWTDAAFYSAAREGDGLSNENQVFADNVLAFIEAQGIGTFSMVGQSQGGMVSLHILNYYHTGMDDAVGERKLQSVATPYMGNSALSNFNGIIDVISGDCPGPLSLTRGGAVEWLSGITQPNVDLTNIYTSKFKPGGLFGGGYCNALMNLILTGDNDGVCEIVYSKPDGGGNDQGTVEGQCHAEDMEWPPSFWDTARNNEMSSKAAR